MSVARLEHAELVGERVRLRPVARTDAPVAYALVVDEPRILDWLIWTGPRDEQELADYYATWARRDDDRTAYLFAIEDRATDCFVGAISLRLDAGGTGTVGYWIGVAYWSGGRCTEAVGLVDHLAFAHLGAGLLSACVFEGNDASRRVLERNGWTCAVPSPVRACAEERPQWPMTLDRADWEARADRVRPAEERVCLADSAS